MEKLQMINYQGGFLNANAITIRYAAKYPDRSRQV